MESIPMKSVPRPVLDITTILIIVVAALVSHSSIVGAEPAKQPINEQGYNFEVIITVFGLQSSAGRFILFLTSEENIVKANILNTEDVHKEKTNNITSFGDYGLEIAYTLPASSVENGGPIRACVVALADLQVSCETANISSHSNPENVIIYMQNSDFLGQNK
jgi:hypothetical protein